MNVHATHSTAVAAALLGVIWVHALTGFGGPERSTSSAGGGTTRSSSPPRVGCLTCAMTRGSERLAWLALGVGLVADVDGDVI